MSFVELNRCFVPIDKNEEPNFDIGRLWGRKIEGWLDWPDLRQQWRVVLMAEASSGKSAEFGNQADVLTANDSNAFYVRIEELADQGFETALEPGIAEGFKRWRAQLMDEGWFFLDAVDEARLNRKSFESALKRFGRELGQSMERARVFISCRVSDWEGSKDCDLIERLLPSWEQARTQENNQMRNPLLDPIFKEKKQSKSYPSRQPERKPHELLVVQLAPLSVDQYRKLAAAFEVNDVNAFVAAISQNGLDAFTERPGDLIDLIAYWKSFGRFASFAEMVEHSINRKLREPEAYRPDNEVISVKKVRQGAERLAAAMTLMKSFNLRAPGQVPDPTHALGAINPTPLLEEWTDAERNALLRRGIFAPSTFGRIRFHHRTTQEYLTSQWLARILDSNCPSTEVWDLIFATRYGVETVVPSLRPSAAWLSLRHPDLLDEIIRREPLILIRYGDPGSLSLENKKHLLESYATKHLAAEIADDSLDHRALWMFSDPGLSDAIRKAWNLNPRPNFRIDLLRLIREGAIVACVDLARSVALDETAKDYHRIVAVEALDACKDKKGLSILVQQISASPDNLRGRFIRSAAKALFPNYLTIDQLLRLIESSQTAPGTFEGLPYCIEELYDLCPDVHARRQFVTRLAELCLSQPFVEGYQRVSRQYSAYANHLEPIARREVQALGEGEPPDDVVRLLMVVERAEQSYHSEDDDPPLSKLVQANVRLQRALFWADVEEERNNAKGGRQLSRLWQVQVNDRILWQLGTADLSWLYEDLLQVPLSEDQQIALSAIVTILQQTSCLESEVVQLQGLVQTSKILKEDLNSYLTPRIENEQSLKHKQRLEENKRQNAEREKKVRADWEGFQKQVQENPNLISDPKYLRSWTAGAYRLWDLTKWLGHRADTSSKRAPLQWRLLEEGFGRQVAEAYRDGMKVLWRLTKPERPEHGEGGRSTIKHLNILAFGAVGLEAAEDPDWSMRLTYDEAKRAALHGCLTEQGYPEWIDALLRSYPRFVLPVLKKCIKYEWVSPSPGLSDFLYHLANQAFSIQPSLQQILFQTITETEPNDLGKLDTGLRIIRNLDLDRRQVRKLVHITRQRLFKYTDTGDIDLALRHLAIVLFLDPDRGVMDLEAWLESINGIEKKPDAERTFAFLFDHHEPNLSSALALASVSTLERLLCLVYSYVRPEHDIDRKGVYSPNVRDDAQSARNVILDALLSRSGAEAFWAVRRVADDPEYSPRAERFRELARGMAERDTELIDWTAKEVVIFEQSHTAPVKTGTDLLRVVMAVLKDIQFQLNRGDFTSRPLLQRAEDEDEVQNWIAEQMNYRSKGRYNAYRESQVAGGNKPDIIVSSTAAQCEVAIEVKHGGKEWTFRQLERALSKQLAEDYLKPPTRRHGVLVITHHRTKRRWRDPETKQKLTFDSLILRLSGIASTLASNNCGPIEVKCVGIDASC